MPHSAPMTAKRNMLLLSTSVDFSISLGTCHRPRDHPVWGLRVPAETPATVALPACSHPLIVDASSLSIWNQQQQSFYCNEWNKNKKTVFVTLKLRQVEMLSYPTTETIQRALEMTSCWQVRHALWAYGKRRNRRAVNIKPTYMTSCKCHAHITPSLQVYYTCNICI